MSNFSAAQAFTVLGLCQTLQVNDVSDYTGNIEGYTEADVQFRKFTFRDSSGAVLKTETFTDGTKVSSIGISLLTFNMSCTLDIFLGSPRNLGYQAYQTFMLACLKI